MHPIDKAFRQIQGSNYLSKFKSGVRSQAAGFQHNRTSCKQSWSDFASHHKDTDIYRFYLICIKKAVHFTPEISELYTADNFAGSL
jgi:hypothetical protein